MYFEKELRGKLDVGQKKKQRAADNQRGGT
jgi:hypothetical protein